MQAKLFLTGGIVLAFVVLHLRAFRFGEDMFIGTGPDGGPWGSFGIPSQMRDLYRLQLELFASLPQAYSVLAPEKAHSLIRSDPLTLWSGALVTTKPARTHWILCLGCGRSSST